MSAGTGSFVTRGRGNAQSWSSCSHGAGRRMSRTAAKANISQVNLRSWLMSPAHTLPVTWVCLAFYIKARQWPDSMLSLLMGGALS